MRLQGLVVALMIAVAGAFVLLNQDVVMEARTVQLPGARVTAPVLGITLLVAVGTLFGMLALGAVEGLGRGRARRRLYHQLAQREHEIAVLKSSVYDRVAPMIEAIHREVSAWVNGEARRQEQLHAQLVALQHAMEARAPSEAGGERELPRIAAEREAA